MDLFYQEEEHDALQYHLQPDGTIECSLCNHRCHIRENGYGICNVRKNVNGKLISKTYGMVSAEALDPIEKKPLYHFLPGTTSYSLGSIGCNFSCAHCQNWHISTARPGQFSLHKIPPEEGVYRAKKLGASSISWTYNEPTIWYEYTREMAKIGRKENLGTVYVTNGYMTEEALSELSPYLDAWRVDLKSFSDHFYRKICKAKLQPVLDTTIRAKELGLHIETVTLIIPGLNDDMEEIKELIQWVITNLGPDTPMHFTRFHPDHLMTDRPATPIKTLEKIYDCAKDLGIHYPYLGNVVNHRYEHTYCPVCGAKLIERTGFHVKLNNLKGTRCTQCNREIAIIRNL